jgi:hypothetical protein
VPAIAACGWGIPETNGTITALERRPTPEEAGIAGIEARSTASSACWLRSPRGMGPNRGPRTPDERSGRIRSASSWPVRLPRPEREHDAGRHDERLDEADVGPSHHRADDSEDRSDDLSPLAAISSGIPKITARRFSKSSRLRLGARGISRVKAGPPSSRIASISFQRFSKASERRRPESVTRKRFSSAALSASEIRG